MPVKKKTSSATKSSASRRGRRNRQRGAELQRETVNIFRHYSIPSFNRDRGGANHEGGDVEIDGFFLGCKRRTRIPRYVIAEKNEIGVVIREDRGEPLLSIPLKPIARLISKARESGIDVKEIFEHHRLGIEPDDEVKTVPREIQKR